MSDEESDDEFNGPIVIDNGSGIMKVGFAGDDAPRAVYPTITGRPRIASALLMLHSSDKDVYVGDESRCKCGILTLNYPIERGVIKDWEDMEKIWHHTFYNELRIAPEEHNVLLTDSTVIAEDREKMAQIMFEKFNVPGLYISLSGILSLYASGRTTGVVLDLGYGVTNIIPVYEGYAVPHAIERMEFGGNEITEYLVKLLAERGHMYTTTAEHETVNYIKETLCYVALNFDEEMQAYEKDCTLGKEFELPAGHTITLKNELFRASEALFNPSLLGMADTPGIHQAIHTSIMKCFPHPHPKHFLPNIVLSGGNSMFNGINERLKKEITQLISPAMVAKVITPPERKYSAWIGGSILASMSTMEDIWITKKEYQEFGPGIVRQKCL